MAEVSRRVDALDARQCEIPFGGGFGDARAFYLEQASPQERTGSTAGESKLAHASSCSLAASVLGSRECSVLGSVLVRLSTAMENQPAGPRMTLLQLRCGEAVAIRIWLLVVERSVNWVVNFI